MNKTGAWIASAAFGFLSAGMASSAMAEEKAGGDQVVCEGINACKGQGSCAGGGQAGGAERGSAEHRGQHSGDARVL